MGPSGTPHFEWELTWRRRAWACCRPAHSAGQQQPDLAATAGQRNLALGTKPQEKRPTSSYCCSTACTCRTAGPSCHRAAPPFCQLSCPNAGLPLPSHASRSLAAREFTVPGSMLTPAACSRIDCKCCGANTWLRTRPSRARWPCAPGCPHRAPPAAAPRSACPAPRCTGTGCQTSGPARPPPPGGDQGAQGCRAGQSVGPHRAVVHPVLTSEPTIAGHGMWEGAAPKPNPQPRSRAGPQPHLRFKLGQRAAAAWSACTQPRSRRQRLDLALHRQERMDQRGCWDHYSADDAVYCSASHE